MSLAEYEAVKTAHFSPAEWCSKHELAEPYPIEWLETRWLPLALVMEKIRAKIGNPMGITPNGGYRCPAHNVARKGARNSRHMGGYAADFQVNDSNMNWTATRAHRLILRMLAAKEITGVTGLGLYAAPKQNFVHIDVGDPESLAAHRTRHWNGGVTQIA